MDDEYARFMNEVGDDKRRLDEEEDDDEEEDFNDEEAWAAERKDQMTARYAAYTNRDAPAAFEEENEDDDESDSGNVAVSAAPSKAPVGTVGSTLSSAPSSSAPLFNGSSAGVWLEGGERFLVRDPSDKVLYEYDSDKRAWFPAWEQNLVDSQQSAYGRGPDADGAPSAASGQQPPETEGTAAAPGSSSAAFPTVLTASQLKRQKREEAKAKALQIRKEAKEVTAKENTAVYVTGLPADVTEEELAAYFSKCGFLAEDFATRQPKVKVYKDKDGRPKGDGSVTYLKRASVELALQLLDDSELRPGNRVFVAEATYNHRGADGGSSEKGGAQKKKRKLDKQQYLAQLNRIEKKLGWFDESEASAKHIRTVILKNMFTPQEVDADPGLLLDLKEDIREECSKMGDVSNVVVYDRHPQGVFSVKFKSEISAAACVKVMNGRFFGGKAVEAVLYDGKERYDQAQQQPSEQEERERLKQYGDWLEKNTAGRHTDDSLDN